jgi:hypothetical protein
MANGKLVNLVLDDVLFVQEAPWNLLSVSKLSQPADSLSSFFWPGLYNCRKSKSPVAQSIPIIPVGSSFQEQTCADAEIKRYGRVQNDWICWHRRLGYLPFNKWSTHVNDLTIFKAWSCPVIISSRMWKWARQPTWITHLNHSKISLVLRTLCTSFILIFSGPASKHILQDILNIIDFLLLLGQNQMSVNASHLE